LGDVRREVVVKRLRPELAAEPRFIARFLEEARVSVRLSHPNVVQTYEFGEVEGRYFLSLEYVQGIDLARLCPLLGRLDARCPIDVALEVVMQAAAGLQYVHTLQDFDGKPMALVHRDVSPSNLMISDSGHVKLLDFGVAGRLDPDRREGIIGKAAYLSPEQIRRQPLDARSDLFGLGIVLWELLVGEQLFCRSNESATLLAVAEAPIPPPSERRSRLPTAVDRIVAGLLERDRARRHASAESLQSDVERVIASSQLRSGPRLLRNFMASLRSLPAARADTPSFEPATSTQRVSAQLPTVVAVDDEEHNLQLMGRVLRRDCKLHLCTSAAEALHVIEHHHVDVLLTDERMPGMSGLELLKRARAIRPAMQRIIVSGFAESQTLLDAINSGGIQRYVLKPWEPAELRQVVADAIRNARPLYAETISIPLKTLEIPVVPQGTGNPRPEQPD
jgi:serine/threonine protein kinase